MRRKDREMNEAFAWEILDECSYSILSLVDHDEEAYGIPVSAIHDGKNIYIHCAKDGKKIELIPFQKRVCLTAVSRVVLKPFVFSTEYASGIFKGRISLVEEEQEKAKALRLICMKYAFENLENCEKAIVKSLNQTAVIKIEVDEVSGKCNKYD